MPNLLKIRPHLTDSDRAIIWALVDWDSWLDVAENLLWCPDSSIPVHFWLVDKDRLLRLIEEAELSGSWSKQLAALKDKICQTY